MLPLTATPPFVVTLASGVAPPTAPLKVVWPVVSVTNDWLPSTVPRKLIAELLEDVAVTSLDSVVLPYC